MKRICGIVALALTLVTTTLYGRDFSVHTKEGSAVVASVELSRGKH